MSDADPSLAAATSSAGSSHVMFHGPYVHQINKGGLDVIEGTSQLVSTEGRFLDEAVRATRFALKPAGPDDRPRIEFYTWTAPTPHPGNGDVIWYQEAGTYLDIFLTRVAEPGLAIRIVQTLPSNASVTP